SEEEAFISSPRDIKKHVRMLDGLALLLISQPMGEVCATALVQEAGSATVYWAKNNPVKADNATQEYLDNLVSAFQEQKSRRHILQLCVVHCRSKILARCQKAAKQFTISHSQSNILGVDKSDPAIRALEDSLRHAGVLSNTSTITDGLDAFVRNLSALGSTSSPPLLYKLICFADSITPRQNIVGEHSPQSRIFNPLQLRRIGKIAAYRKIITYVLKVCKENNITRLREQQISRPAQQNVQVHTRTQDALNTISPHIPFLPAITKFEQIANRFDGANKGSGAEGQQHAILASQHCEITLALYFLEVFLKVRRGGSIEIGCSKASCYWCHLYLEQLNEHLVTSNHNIKIVTFANHGKRTKGWLMPEGQKAVTDAVLQEVGYLIEDVFRRAWGVPRKKSDSRSLFSSFFGSHSGEEGNEEDEEGEEGEGRFSPQLI
ncbi:MAG: hypothetical protein Q9163_006497, partial [Psora crenata]